MDLPESERLRSATLKDLEALLLLIKKQENADSRQDSSLRIAVHRAVAQYARTANNELAQRVLALPRELRNLIYSALWQTSDPSIASPTLTKSEKKFPQNHSHAEPSRTSLIDSLFEHFIVTDLQGEPLDFERSQSWVDWAHFVDNDFMDPRFAKEMFEQAMYENPEWPWDGHSTLDDED